MRLINWFIDREACNQRLTCKENCTVAGIRMTEQRWLAEANAESMLRYARRWASERKLRLLAVALSHEYYRREPQFDTPESRRAIEVAEALAESDGPVTDAIWRAHRKYFVLHPSGYGAASRLIGISDIPQSFRGDLLRCLFGNPFRPTHIEPDWLTSTVLALANAVYEERAFHRLPALAKVIKEAGCADQALLAHCTSMAPHARGCWVIDALLGMT
jgi:hypothetical protein